MIKLNKHFLKQSIALQKSAMDMNREKYACVYIEDVESNNKIERKYYCTDGHSLIFYREPINQKEFEGPVYFHFEKLPATKDSYYDVEINRENLTAKITTKEGKSVDVDYADTEHLFLDCFETVKGITSEKEIESFKDATEFILFNDEVIKVVKNFIGVGLYCSRPKVKNEFNQKNSPVFWHNTDNSMIAVAMPMKLEG